MSKSVLLNHAERRARRARMAEAVASGRGVGEVAAEFGVTANTVRDACVENRVGRRVIRRAEGRKRPAPLERWRDADWSMRDTDLALMMGVSRERVRQIRKALGKAKAEFHHVSNAGIRIQKWLQSHAALVPSLTVAQILECVPFTTSYSCVVAACQRLGIQPAPAMTLSQLVTKETLANFVEMRPGTECWEWKLGVRSHGYGSVGGNSEYAHRHVYELFHGPIPADKPWVLHTCDNPKCVNPVHLYAGTPMDNSRDREVRERGNVKRTPAEVVVAIRQRFGAGERIASLAREYGLTYSTAYRIAIGKARRFVLAAAS